MNKKKLLTVLLVITVVIIGIIAFRIYSNLAANKLRAGRASQGRSIAVETMAVGKRDVEPILLFSANVEPVWSADISAKLEARLEELQVEEGMLVKAGQVIARLNANEMQAQTAQAQGSWYAAKAAYEQAEVDYERMKKLAVQGAVSQQALDAARYKRDLTQGQVAAAEGSLNAAVSKVDYTVITAPRDAVVLKRFLQAGTVVKVGTPIVTLGDVTTLLVKATVSESQIGFLEKGLAVKVRLNAFPGKVFTGSIVRISPMAALPARTFTAEVEIANKDGIIRPGMYASCEIQGLAHKNVFAVPQEALVMREDQKTVFVVLADGLIQQRLLKIGYSGNGWVEVADGLKEGEKIVISGQNRVRDGVKVTVGAPNKEGSK